MTEAPREPVQSLLDVVFYAPIGAFFHGPAVVAELAERGRAQVANARVLGGVAVERGRNEVAEAASVVQSHLGDLLAAAARAAGAPMAGADDIARGPGSEDQQRSGDEGGSGVADNPAQGNAATDDDPVEAANLRVVADASTPPAAALPIPDYDNLSASQVVPRLDDLAAHELDAVRDYEAAHRGRMTILSRIAQLQAS